jgi:hypothetical protein
MSKISIWTHAGEQFTSSRQDQFMPVVRSSSSLGKGYDQKNAVPGTNPGFCFIA